MSGRTEKAKRKLAKQEIEKRMQPNQQQPRQINIISELEGFIMTCELLTGEKPASMTLTDAMYNMYIQVAQKHAETLGLNPGFKTEEPTFLGVKLVKKSPIITPTPIITNPSIEMPAK